MAVRVGIVGCGSVSWEHVRRLSLLGGGEVRVMALCDVAGDKAESLRGFINRFRNISPEPLSSEAIFVNYDEMLSKAELDAVIVCTPHTLHHDHVLKALRGGLHALVEKPMAVSVREAEEMNAEALKRHLVLTVGYQRHCQPECLFARRQILSGELGEPHIIVGWLVQNLLAAGRFYLDQALSGGGLQGA